jgi:hypothetical protein
MVDLESPRLSLYLIGQQHPIFKQMGGHVVVETLASDFQ